MRPVMHVYTAFAAALCVGGFLLGGGLLVTALVLAGLAALTWHVAAASRPRPRGRRVAVGRAERRPVGPVARLRPASGMRIRDERDTDVVHDEGRKGEGVEDLMEAEPPR